MKYIAILLLIFLFACAQDEVLLPDIYGTYSDGDSGILIVNENYIDYRNVWHTTEYNLTQDSLIFHVSRAKDCCPNEIVTWWFELKINVDILEGNNYKTVNFDPDFIENRGMIYFRK